MAYIKTTWKDRLVERPNTFEVQENPDGTITLIPTPGTVTQAGTPVNATNLNKIEDGIVNLENATAAHLAESSNKHVKDSGSNPDGSWIRFENGTMICWGTKDVGAIETAWGNGFRTIANIHIPFPQTFIGLPVPSISGYGYGEYSCWGGCELLSTDSFGAILLRFTSSPVTYTCVWNAIGKWK